MKRIGNCRSRRFANHAGHSPHEGNAVARQVLDALALCLFIGGGMRGRRGTIESGVHSAAGKGDGRRRGRSESALGSLALVAAGRLSVSTIHPVLRGRLHRPTRRVRRRRHLVSDVGQRWTPLLAVDGRRCQRRGLAPGAGRFGNGTVSAGYAVIDGDDPLKLTISRVGLMKYQPFPYWGQYPSGSLVHNGVWYYGTYALDTSKREPQVVWDIMGPLVGFNISTDGGKTWRITRTASSPLFGQFGDTGKDGQPVLMGRRQAEYDRSPYAKGTPAPGSRSASALRRFWTEHGAFAGRQGVSAGAGSD